MSPSDIERAGSLIEEARAIIPHHGPSCLAKGHLLRAQGRFVEAIPEYETVVAFNRNWVVALTALGHCRLLTGAVEEAIAPQEQALRVSPGSPRAGNWYWRIGMAHLLLCRIDQAIGPLQKAHSVNPRLAGPHAWLASAYALKDDFERAIAELALARELCSDDRYSSLARLRTRAFGGVVAAWALFDTTYFAGLRRAGMPEE